jgi:branched-chain amino acid transport system permease protein
VVGLCGLLDLGYIAFYAVGAYTYSLLNLKLWAWAFWAALPIGVVLGMICGCIIGYPTLKMRGDYLAIVTLGFGEIVRLVLNNWDSLTAGPNGLFGMKRPAYSTCPASPRTASSGRVVTHYVKSLPSLYYYLILAIAVFTILGVRHGWTTRASAAPGSPSARTKPPPSSPACPPPGSSCWPTPWGRPSPRWPAPFSPPSSATPTRTSSCSWSRASCCASSCWAGWAPSRASSWPAFVLIAVPEVFRELEAYRMLAFGAIMTTMMVIKPEGLIPASRRKARIRHDRPTTSKPPRTDDLQG